MQEQQTVEVIYGINPVKEALRAGMPIERAYTCKAQGAVLPLIGQLKAMKVPILEVDEKRMSFLCPKEEGCTPNHQGIVIQLSAAAYVEVEDLLRAAARKGEDPLIIVLDGITDPHNMGAIMRSAEALGAHGIIIPKRRSAGLSATAFRASSGAAAHIGVARVTNLAATLDQLKEYGLWVAGTAAGAPDCNRANLKGAVALCIGSEGDGLAHLTEQKCDFMVGIPLKGKTESLNASCAATVLIYEVLRQRIGG